MLLAKLWRKEAVAIKQMLELHLVRLTIVYGTACLFILFVSTIACGQGIEEAKAAYERGYKAYGTGDMPKAIQEWSDALRIYEITPGTEGDHADCCKNIGVALEKMGKDEEAIARYEQALRLYQTIKGTESDQAACYEQIGVAFWIMSKYEESIDSLGKALSVYKTISGTKRDQADCYLKIGVALWKLGKCEEAIVRREQALAIYKTIDNTERDQASLHYNIGWAFANMDKFEDALAESGQALGLYKTIKGTEQQQGHCYLNMGVALHRMGKHEEAIARLEQALAIYQAVTGTERWQAGCFKNIGSVLDDMGKYEEAISHQEQALRLYQAIKGAERDQAGCYVDLGVVLGYMGKYKEEIAKLEHALAICRNISGTEREKATCYLDTGWVLWNISEYENAISKCEQAISVYKGIEGTEREQKACYGNIGWAHFEAGQFSEAIETFRQAGHSWWGSQGLGDAYRSRGQPGDRQRAVEAFWDAVNIAEQTRTSVKAFEHRTVIFEEPATVFPAFVSLLVELNEKKAKVEQPEILHWSIDPNSDHALLESAFHFAERGKGRALEDALREKVSLKAATPDMKLLSEDKELSLRISKLFSLREELPATEPERRKKLTEDIEQLQQRRNMIEAELKRTVLGAYISPEFRKPMDMAKDLEPNTAVLQYSIGEKEGWLLILTREGVAAYKIEVNTPALPELLPRQQATLEQLANAWKTRPDKVGLDGLVRLARARVEDQGRSESQRKNIVDANQEKAILERLGKAVLPDTALADLRQKKIHHLLVIPDGSLNYVPFAMLRIKDKDNKATQYVIEEFATSSVPAMTTLETIRKQKKDRQTKQKTERRQLLAFANPDFGTGVLLPAADELVTRMRSFRHDYYSGIGLKLTSLPETEAEATRVASLFAEPKLCRDPMENWPEGESVVCVSAGASEEQAKRLLAGGDRAPHWRYVLFSTHGMADTRNGMLSCLALSAPGKDSTEDGLLQAQEILDMELDTDLVMLSACQTGLGRLSGGEGLVGLSGAFFVAGTETVGASLWQVPSAPTGQLVTEFFKNLKEGKVDRAEAMRQAQLQVMRQGKSPDGKNADYSAPFCWAAFVLMGEYR